MPAPSDFGPADPAEEGRKATGVAVLPARLDEVEKEVSSTAPWYALYTRSRHEKAVDERLHEKDIESFLPLYDIQSRWKDRRKWVQKPVFPGYLFARPSPESLWLLSVMPGVVQVVGDGRRPIPVPDDQVDAVRRMVESSARVAPLPYLQAGRRVYVRVGPLQGIEGFIVRRNGRHRLVVSVDLLGRSVAAEVDIDCVEPL